MRSGSSQQMTSETRGIGQLLEERRYFQVPLHQRDYSWGTDIVKQFLDDVTEAMQNSDRDYFLGLIVLVAPGSHADQRFEILDGQQRLATTTMIYAAIRHWLLNNNGQQEAQKIQNRFIGISEIGKDKDEPRLVLNLDNRAVFQDVVVAQCSDSVLKTKLLDAGKHSSSRMVLEAALTCRTYVAEEAGKAGADPKAQAERLFGLAKYLRDHVQVNCLDVNEPENAYTIFESLNDRGIDLSVLDLLKNHLFRETNPERHDDVRHNWGRMIARLGDRKADDFLKVYWTSRFGRIQRGRLFRGMKAKHADEESVMQLSNDLAAVAETYAAMDSADGELWRAHSESARSSVSALEVLGSLQTRPILLSALARFTESQLETLLRFLVTLIVRYQVIGRGRTGRLEIASAAIAPRIFSGELATPRAVIDELRTLLPPDDEFVDDFARYSESKPQRARYLLRELELQRWRQLNPSKAMELGPLTDPERVNLEHIMPKSPDESWGALLGADGDVHSECLERLGNLCLLAAGPNRRQAGRSFADKLAAAYKSSDFLLTSELVKFRTWGRAEIDQRQRELAALAALAWRV